MGVRPEIVGPLSALALLDPAFAFVHDGAATSADPADSAEEPIEEIIVTGSRIRRDTCTSIAPLQVTTVVVA